MIGRYISSGCKMLNCQNISDLVRVRVRTNFKYSQLTKCYMRLSPRLQTGEGWSENFPEIVNFFSKIQNCEPDQIWGRHGGTKLCQSLSVGVALSASLQSGRRDIHQKSANLSSKCKICFKLIAEVFSNSQVRA